MLVVPVLAIGQEGLTISGKVTDAAGNPLPGANVTLAGFNLGSSTDTEGNYSFRVPNDRVNGQSANLTASFIGYRSKSTRITLSGDAMTQSFSLPQDILGLGEVVVMGYGEERNKEKLGVTIAKVEPTLITQTNEVNVVQALSAQVSNVEVTASSGDPGSSSYLRIRGAHSITGGTQPLFVVDGIPVSNQTFGNTTGGAGGAQNRTVDINPEDVASMEILKGAAASAAYGSRAANGVVLITTKRGRPGKVNVSYKMSYSFDELNRRIPLQTRFGQGSGGVASTTAVAAFGPELTADTPVFDHYDEIYEMGHQFENVLTFSGGNEYTSYFLSGGRVVQNGITIGEADYVRNNVRLNASQRILNNLTVGGNLAYTNSQQDRIQVNSNTAGLMLGALRTPPDFDNSNYLTPEGFHRSYRVQNPTTLAGSRGYDNPFFVLYNHTAYSNVDRLIGNIDVDWDPLPWLNVHYTLGSDFYNDNRRTVLPLGNSSVPNGQVAREEFFNQIVDHNLVVRASRQLNPNIAYTFSLGQNLNRSDLRSYQVTGTQITVDGFNQLDGTITLTPNEFEAIVHTEGYFGQLTVDMYDQLYLTASLRNDGASTFGKSDPRHWYPKASAAWDFSKFGGIRNKISFLNFGKIRAAYGEAGVQPDPYSTNSIYFTGNLGEGWGPVLSTRYSGFGGYVSGANKGQDNIKPERTKETEVGIDLAFWNERLFFNTTYYNALTTDALIQLPLARTTGYVNQLQNAAEIRNEGVEMSLQIFPVRTRDFEWDAQAIWGRNNNRVIDLSGAGVVGLSGFAGIATFAIEGQPYSVIRGVDYVRFGRGSVVSGVNIDQTYPDAPKGALYIAADGYPVIDAEQRVIGDPNPDWTGSIRNTFTFFRKFKVSALIDVKHGGEMWNGTAGALYQFGTHKDTEIRGQMRVFGQNYFENQQVAGPGAGKEVVIDQTWFQNKGSGFLVNSPFIEDAGYVKLREIALSYNLNTGFVKSLGLSDIDVRVSGRNLHTWTDYKGIDPETNLTGTSSGRGLEYFNNPYFRSYAVSFRLNY
jgi:TonB-linked SusC/RagA family outer membrane protein